MKSTDEVKPTNETERLQALRRLNIPRSPPDPALDDITRLAAELCSLPVTYIAFVEESEIWFKSCHGITMAQQCRQNTFSAEVILEPRVLVFADSESFPRFVPLELEGQKLHFHVGTPLLARDGQMVGALCLADVRHHQIGEKRRKLLEALARQVMTHLELNLHLQQLEESIQQENQARSALRASESFYEALVESLPQNILRKDREGRFTFANKRFCESVKMPLSEIRGKTDFEIYPRYLAQKYHDDDLEIMKNKTTVELVETNQPTSSSPLVIVHVIKCPLFDSQGEVVGIQGIFWDITERHRIEEQLAYERDLLRSLLDATPDRIYFKDKSSRFIRCSRSMAERLGLNNPEEVIGKTDLDFHHVEAAREFIKEEQRILETGEPLINKIQRSKEREEGNKDEEKDGEKWSAVSKVAIRNQQGVVTGILGISRDVTHMIKTEEALEKARDEALRNAQVKAEFLANMSHEIRTPMNAIMGMTDLILASRLDPEQHEYASAVSVSAQALLSLINSILDFSKAEAGKLVMEKLDFDLRHLVESTTDMLAENAFKKQVELNQWIDESIPTRLKGDPGRIRQVLVNLLGNAIKFTDQGEVSLNVTMESRSGPEVRLRFTIIDTGIGIASDALPVIFDAFTQADSSTTRKYGGTGLGLAISRQLVTLMGGKIGVESTPGMGSEFSFVIPLEIQAGAMDCQLIPCPGEEGARILIVENNATTLQNLNRCLAAHNHHCQSAPNGIDALTVLRKEAATPAPFQVVMFDSNMTGLDAMSLARAIKQNPLTSKTRLLLLTWAGALPDRAKRESVGIDACLLKPVKQARLFETLHNLMAPPRPEKPTPAQEPVPEIPRLPSQNNLRILLAEDNPMNRRLVLCQLQKLGFAADAVENGLEAVNACTRQPYQIILMDCQMPEMDGYKATQAIRGMETKNPDRFPVPAYIVAISANAMQGDRERGLQAGMNDYLTKPLRLDDLRSGIERALQALPVPPAAPGVPNASAPEEINPVLDPAILNSLKDLREPGMPDPVEELIQLYLKDARTKLDNLDAWAAAHKLAEFKAAIHSLKGSSRNIGARPLASLLEQIEIACKNEDWDEITRLTSVVPAEFEKVQKRLLDEIAPPPR